MKIIRILLITFLFPTMLQLQTQEKIIKDGWKKFYDAHGLQGAFALYDLNKKQYYLYNPAHFTQEYLPASTFKICNSLIGLETGVIAHEHFIINWDGKDKGFPAWNADHNLQDAFKNSTVWYYQELARRVGSEKMKYWLDKAKYGNTDTSGGIDYFWLTGGLRITMDQQIDFLKRLYNNQLPFPIGPLTLLKGSW